MTADHTARRAPGAASRRRRGPWLAAAVALWTLVLLGTAYRSMRHDEPTVPEQRDIAAATGVANRAIGVVLAAVGDDAAFEISAPRLTPGCRLTPFRDGATLERSITVRTAEGAAPTALGRIADRLPPTYRATTRTGPSGLVSSLRADAGEFVSLRGVLAGPDVVTVTAATGCRPAAADFDPAVDLLIGLPIDEEPARVLAALRASPDGPVDRVGVPCPGRGAAYTARAAGRDSGRARLGEALHPLPGATVVTDTPDVYAYRDGSRSLVVERVAGEIRVSATQGCAQ